MGKILEKPEAITWLETEFLEFGALLNKQVYYQEVVKG